MILSLLEYQNFQTMIVNLLLILHIISMQKELYSEVYILLIV